MHLRMPFDALRIALYLQFLAPRPPGKDSVSLSERLAAFPEKGVPVEGRVEVYWDSHQIPFIEAENDRDLAVTLGLVHAHLRLGQMEVLRRVAFGRVSEMVGPVGLDLDHTLRIFDLGRAVPEIERQLPNETRHWLLGFISGINHCLLRTDAALPHEFALFDLKREPWTIADILTLGRLFASDLMWLIWLRLLQARRLRGWRRIWARLIEMDGAAVAGDRNPLRAAALQAALASGRTNSNCLAVSGSRGANGSAWIASDPHLGLSLPCGWLIGGYRSPNHHAAGLMIPGMPFIALGRNPWIAWGGSYLHAIASELLNVSHLPQAALQTREERVEVRWSAARKIRIRTCEAGPVLSDSIFYRAPGERLALGWVGHRASDEITAMLNVSCAKNWEEFKAAIDSFAVPGQNMIFAGATGDIGHALAAWVPTDAQDAPDDLITRAASARSDFHTANSLPSWRDPPTGFVISANNRPDTKLAIGRLFSSPDRAARITAILRNSTIDFPLLVSIQRDVRSDSAKKLAARLAQIAGAGSSETLAPKSARILSFLEGWTGEYDADSPAPAAFEILLFHFCQLYYPRSVLSAYSAAWALRDLIRSDIETADKTRIRPVVLKALKRTARSLRSRSWGQLHRLRIDHPLGLLPLAGRRYRYFDLPTSGGSETVMKTANGLTGGRHAVRFGSNARHISKLSESDENYFILLGGQDGWFGSTTFADQLSLWREGKYIQVPLQLEPVRRSFPFLTEISPAPKTGPSTASKQSGGP
jgi:penicillin G amidase